MSEKFELMPCPFCGRVPNVVYDMENVGYVLYHPPESDEDECPIASEESLGEWVFDTPEEARDCWNKRY